MPKRLGSLKITCLAKFSEEQEFDDCSGGKTTAKNVEESEEFDASLRPTVQN